MLSLSAVSSPFFKLKAPVLDCWEEIIYYFRMIDTDKIILLLSGGEGRGQDGQALRENETNNWTASEENG